MSNGDTAQGARAPGIVAPELRDLDELAATLSRWLTPRLDNASDVRISNLDYPRGAGMSHETILFDATWRDGAAERTAGLVVRIKPTRQKVYVDDMFEQQYLLMKLMHERGQVRVAKPLWLEHDPTILGAPFFIMEKVHGRVAVSYPPYAREGWMVETSPADRRTLWEDSVRQLAAIQLTPISAAPFLQMPGTFAEPFDQEVDRWTRYLNAIDPNREFDLLRSGYDQLLAARPGNRPEGIVWGDSRLGNMMIGPDFKVAAVMDWEQPSLGGALHDLGWWLLSEHNQTTGQGIKLEGMGSRDETIALWSEVCGKSAADIGWYETFVVFKQECLAIRMSSWSNMQVRTGNVVPGRRLQAFMDRA